MMKFDEAVRKLVDQYIPAMAVEKFKEDAQELAKDELKAEAYRRIIENTGYLDPDLADSEKGFVPFKDLITSTEFKHLFPKVVKKIALDVIEPNLVLTPLFEKVRVKGPVITVRIPQLSLGSAANLDIGEGAEPPEITVQTGGAYMDVTIGKSGVAVALTEEAINANSYNILDMSLKAAAMALARHKENKAANNVFKWGNANILLDGDSGSDDLKLSGVDAAGNYNNGLTLDDLIRAGVKFIEKGFNMDVLIMHPLAFEAFMTNGTLRRLFYESAGVRGQYVNWPKASGQPKAMSTYGGIVEFAGTNVMGFEMPGSKIIGKSLKVVLTPFAPFDASTKKFDIIVADSSAIGYYLVAQEPTTTKLPDNWRDVLKIKIVEKYAFAPKFNGEGLGVIKNVKAVKTYDIQLVKNV